MTHNNEQKAQINNKQKGNKMSGIDDLFESINESFNAPATQSSRGFGDILRFEKGKNYIVRLLPFVEDPKKTFFPFKYHGWVSKSTGQYVEFTDPSIVGKPNPIKKYSFDLSAKYRELKLDKEDPRMKRARGLWTRDAWLINCYVVDDPSNPENNGTVKVLRVGKQLHEDVIYEAWKGERKDEFGMKIFDLSPKGCNLKIICADNGGGYKDYKKSYFMNPSEIEEIGSDKDKIKEVWDDCFDLTTVYPIKEYDELKDALELHFIGNVDGAEDEEDEPEFGEIEEMIEDNSDEEEEPKKTVKKTSSKKTTKTPSNKAPEKEVKKEETVVEEVDDDDEEFDIDKEIENL